MGQDHIYLEYSDTYSNSNKYWEAILDGKTFTTNFGRINTTGQNRTKELPTEAAASKAYNAKVREKLAKGYVEVKDKHTLSCSCAWCSGKAPLGRAGTALPVGRPRLSATAASKIEDLLADEDEAPSILAGVPTTTNGNAPKPPELRPMLAEEVDHLTIVKYVEDEDWFIEQKVDGHRVLITVHNGRATATGRNGQSSQHGVRLMQSHYGDISKLGTVVLDGELVGDVFWLFDMPWNGDGIDLKSTYEERRDALDTLMAVWKPEPKAFRLLPTGREHDAKAKLALDCLQKGGEGVMLKRRNGIYVPGGRVRHVLKAKFIKDADFVITGIGLDGHDNYELSLYRDGKLEVIGRCSAIGKEKCQIGDVAVVRYLYIGADGRLYQPRFMSKRTDKAPEECLWSQIDHSHVNKAVFA